MRSLLIGLALTVVLAVLSGCGSSSDGGMLSPGGGNVGASTQEVRIEAQKLPRFCPPPTRGDREFGGYGPEVWADVELVVTPDDREIWVRGHMKAEETHYDWTAAEGTFQLRLYTAPEGWSIDTITSATESSTYYLDTDTTVDEPPLTGDLVSRFVIHGDTVPSSHTVGFTLTPLA